MFEILEKNGYAPIKYQNVKSPATGLVFGRSPLEGYQRGVGLEFGSLGGQVDTHPLFREACDAVGDRTLLAPDRIRNLFLLITGHLSNLDNQNIIEFGSYRGGSLIFMATLLKRLYPEAKIFGLDTYSGMPKSNLSIDLHGEGEFSDTSVEEIKDIVSALGLDNIVLLKGLVQDTFPGNFERTQCFALAHIDLDLYEPIHHVQTSVWNYMCPGGYIVYDDATVSTCIGATQAVEEFIIANNVRSEQVYPHFVFRSSIT